MPVRDIKIKLQLELNLKLSGDTNGSFSLRTTEIAV